MIEILGALLFVATSILLVLSIAVNRYTMREIRHFDQIYIKARSLRDEAICLLNQAQAIHNCSGRGEKADDAKKSI